MEAHGIPVEKNVGDDQQKEHETYLRMAIQVR